MAAYVPHHSETQPFSSEAGRWPVRGFSLGNDLGSDAATRDGTSVKIRRRTALISVGLAATLALGYLTLFELIPVNRSPITITGSGYASSATPDESIVGHSSRGGIRSRTNVSPFTAA